MLEPNYSEQKDMEVSNDTFHFLQYGEEPLDDYNQAEIDDIQNMFPTGFYISDYFFNDDSGTVIITIMPYTEVDFSPHFILPMHRYLDMECEVNGKHVRFRYVSKKTGAKEIRTALLRINQYNNEYFVIGDGDEDFIPGKNSMIFTNCKSRINLKKAAK